MTSVPLPTARPAGPRCIDALDEALGPQAVVRDEVARTQASTDYAWLSPVLTEDLPADARADVVALPGDTDELARVLAIAHDHDVAVTVRGKGTGNYGQVVPLARGIVVDTSRLDAVVEVGDGYITAQPGISFTRLEAAARLRGQELALFPSTVNSALGGFLSGGASGAGSIEHGFVWDGFVRRLDMLPCWDRPELQTMEGAATQPYLHAYGTTGVVAAATVRLVPARRWVGVSATFPIFENAIAAGLMLMALEPAPRNLSVDDAAVTACFPIHPSLVPGLVSVRAVVEESTIAEATHAIERFGGRVVGARTDAAGLFVSLSFTHVTLRVKRADASFCHVQLGGDAVLERHEEVRAALPGGMLHLDGMWRHGKRGFGAVLLSRYVDRDTLYRGMRTLASLGCTVIDPHTWQLGGHGGLDELRAAARSTDPKGLLNPGKLPAA